MDKIINENTLKQNPKPFFKKKFIHNIQFSVRQKKGQYIPKQNQNANPNSRKDFQYPGFASRNYKSPKIYEQFPKSVGRINLISKTRMTPPLHRSIKSERQLIDVYNSKTKKKQYKLRNDTQNKQQKLRNSEQLRNQLQLIKNLHKQQIRELKNIIIHLLKKKDLKERKMDENSIIKNLDKMEEANKKNQIEYYKILLQQMSEQKNHIMNVLKSTKQRYERQIQSLKTEIQKLQKRITVSSCRIDHIYSHQNYDKSKNNVENQISEIDQKYEMSNIVRNNIDINNQYYNNETKIIRSSKNISRNSVLIETSNFQVVDPVLKYQFQQYHPKQNSSISSLELDSVIKNDSKIRS